MLLVICRNVSYVFWMYGNGLLRQYHRRRGQQLDGIILKWRYDELENED